ncbi:MAG: hypothetical protein Q9174_004647, partial [Haloplaca sp. 1 TL-2023]
GTTKTYARQPQRDFLVHYADLPRKRIRMGPDGSVVEERFNMPDEEPPARDPDDCDPDNLDSENRQPSSSTVPSSPPPAGLDDFSDVPAPKGGDTDSPPSSPPPCLPSPKAAVTKPAFSFLKRKRSSRHNDGAESASEPLTDMAPNIQTDPPRPSKRTRLTQMQIDLGGEVQKTCKTCGMEYIPSNREDAALHKEFHAMNLGGVEVGKRFQTSKDMKKAYPRDKKWLNAAEDMVVVDRKSPQWARNKVRKILEVVNMELGSAEIRDEELWAASPVQPESVGHSTKKKKGNDEPEKMGDRFKAFLHIDGEKCVGLCLVEKISGAKKVVDSESNEVQKRANEPGLRSSSICVSKKLGIALLGIARIWTSKSHRGRGIAQDLLDAARVNFFYGVEIKKEMVAFSQPTESGGRLAQRWYGQKSDWLVYGE